MIVETEGCPGHREFPERKLGQRISSGFAGGLERFVSDLTMLCSRLTNAGDPALGNRIHSMIRMLTNEEVAVCLAGCFSSGKSTFLNSLVGRNLLPVKDLPETGASCHLTSGPVDRAEIVTGAALREIECCEPAIREYVSLRRGQRGEVNSNAAKTMQLRIYLADSPIPPRVFWVDSPGFDDSREMEDRARSTIEQSDFVVWVLSSKQFLKEYEQEIIAELVHERGADGIVLLLNAYLENDTQGEWETFLMDNMPVHRIKLDEVGTEMGFPEGNLPELRVASARAMAGDGRFGGEEVRRLLQSIDSPACLEVVRARIHRAQLELADIESKLSSEVQRLGAEVHDRDACVERATEEMEKQKSRFHDAVADALAAFRSSIRTGVEKAAREMDERLMANGVDLGHDYGLELNEALDETFAQSFEALKAGIANLPSRFGRLEIAPGAVNRLRCLLEPRAISFKKVNNVMTGSGVAAGAAGGAAMGAWFFGIGALPGAIIGAVAGAVRDMNKACRKDVEELRECIRTAVEEACQQQERIGTDAHGLLMDCAVFELVMATKGFEEAERLAEKEERLARVRILVKASAEMLEGMR